MLISRLICSCAVVCVAAPFAQVSAQDAREGTREARENATAAKSPVAYVYVASTQANGSTNEVVAYAAAGNGKLTPVPGSPFQENVTSMAVNGVYLMGASQSNQNVNAYRIEANGSLTYATTTDYATPNQGCGFAGSIYFDHTGADLYIQEFRFDCANTGVASFAVDKPTGGLNYLGVDNTGAFPGDFTPASFIADNLYAYTADNDSCMYYTIYGFKRGSNGLLGSIPASFNLPTPPPSFSRYIPALSAADRTNHVAFVMYPGMPPGCTSNQNQLATYTADASGNLNTTNTYTNMPTTLIATPNDLKMAPSGLLLAVAGQEGLQVFHFNGANPITHETGLLTKDPINQMFWDNDNHLYAISKSSGKLHVFTITPNDAHEAPGSPYTISNPDNIIVQPWPLPWA
jgi:hypothetical protein